MITNELNKWVWKNWFTLILPYPVQLSHPQTLVGRFNRGVGREGLGCRDSPRVLLNNPICLLTFPLFATQPPSHSPAHDRLMVDQCRSLQYLEWRQSEVNIGYIAPRPRARHDKDCTSPDPQTRSCVGGRGGGRLTYKETKKFIYLHIPWEQ